MTLTGIPNVLFLPGAIQPAAIQYAPLLKVLGDTIRPLLKDLDVYRDDVPPTTYSLLNEVEGVRRLAEDSGISSFHLVGYSGGGAVALAFTGAYPEIVESLALSDPAVIPSQSWYEQESGYWQQMGQVMDLPDNLLMQEFIRVELRQDVPLPPPPVGDPPPWMAKRPAGIRALVNAFSRYNLSYSRLREFTRPVYLAVTALSNPVELRKADLLNDLFSNSLVEIYQERHHFDPPQRAEPKRFAQALTNLWLRANSL